MRRTLQTALLAFERELAIGVKLHLEPDAQELHHMPCDTG